MTEHEFWARAFLTSPSWTDDGDVSGWNSESKAYNAASFADAALAEYRKRFGTPPPAACPPTEETPPRESTEHRLRIERERLAELEAKFASYDGGDRAPSPPVKLLSDITGSRRTIWMLEDRLNEKR